MHERAWSPIELKAIVRSIAMYKGCCCSLHLCTLNMIYGKDFICSNFLRTEATLWFRETFLRKGEELIKEDTYHYFACWWWERDAPVFFSLFISKYLQEQLFLYFKKQGMNVIYKHWPICLRISAEILSRSTALMFTSNGTLHFYNTGRFPCVFSHGSL